MRWDLFCRVVDNFGDAGVCWRLARQLAAEHRLDVTLRIDDLATLARIEPALDRDAAAQRARGVAIASFDAAADPADVVVEGFGCGLPEPYLDAMQARSSRPLWFDLEYLSAEAWVEGVHGLASRHPRRPLTRYFWFPGFTAKTGGLIREAELLRSRDAGTLREPGIPRDPALTIVLFCYENRALPALFDQWAQNASPVHLIVPEGVAGATLAKWLHGPVPGASQVLERGSLTLDLCQFRSQDEFDRLLWSADACFVRGEDSFVRAQWAAKPFVWQPYPQEGGAQVVKLEAFLARYAPDASDAAQRALRELSAAFNREDGLRAALAWPAFRAALPALAGHARRWSATLAELPDLATGLVAFARAHL